MNDLRVVRVFGCVPTRERRDAFQWKSTGEEPSVHPSGSACETEPDPNSEGRAVDQWYPVVIRLIPPDMANTGKG